LKKKCEGIDTGMWSMEKFERLYDECFNEILNENK